QRRVSIQHIATFDEELGILLLSSLFIILSARLNLEDITNFGLGNVAFLALLILVARPLAVLVSTIRSPFSWRERAFLAWVAPRGIVAAAVASLFAFDLEELGFADTERLVSVTFTVVVGTVTVYALTAKPLARLLNVVQTNPQGTLIVGAHRWAILIAKSIQDAGFEVILVDSNPDHVADARQAGLRAVEANILGDELLNELPFERLGRLLALTSNSELNALAALRFAEFFGRDNVYQLTTDRSRDEEKIREVMRGNILFDSEMDYDHFESWCMQNAQIEIREVATDFSAKQLRGHFGPALVPLFIVRDKNHLEVISAASQPKPAVGQKLISFVHPSEMEAQRLRDLVM
ncbi:MAG: NAD-binding protein, partial [Anaerolineales bacterium]|nr:NAD-binding protein [Anaerolineales bacterium]